MSPSEENNAVVRRLVEDLFNTGDPGIADEILADDYVDHSSSRPDLSGPENVKRSIADWLAAFPDTVSEIRDLVSEGGTVAVRWTTRATHRAESMDTPRPDTAST